MRRLIACADGTWNAAEAVAPTNVVHLARAIVPIARDGVSQVAFYHPGVGTGNALDRLTGGAFGQGLSNNIKDIYRFFVYNYAPGDQVSLFGFSRGAYTVRSAVGMIRKCGLLRKEHADHLQEAYALYRDRGDHVDGASTKRFRAEHSWPEFRIECLGVWDTVGALGVPLTILKRLNRRRYEFHDVKLSRLVHRAFHAVSIDERRRPFEPTLWETQGDPRQIVDQVWFAGVHGDVGGGYRERGLADITLCWMKQRAEEAGIEFDNAYIASVLAGPLPEAYAAPIHNSLRGLYHLWWPLVRKMGRHAKHCDAAADTAVRRLQDASLQYDAPNLAGYLRWKQAKVEPIPL